MQYWWVWLIVALIIVGVIVALLWYWQKEEAKKLIPLNPIKDAMANGGWMQKGAQKMAHMKQSVGDVLHDYGVGEDGQVHHVDEACPSGLHHADGSYTSSNVLYPGSYRMADHYLNKGHVGFGPEGPFGKGMMQDPGYGAVKGPFGISGSYREHSSYEGPLSGHGRGQGQWGNAGGWRDFKYFYP